MNQGQGANSWLMVGGMVSLFVHLIGGLAVIGVSDPDPGQALQSFPLPPGEDQTQDEDKPVLGVEDSTSVSINWLGFADPTEHRGQLSDTEQPALSLAPMGEPSDQPAAAPTQTQTQDSPSQRAPVGPASGQALTAATPTPTDEPLEPAPSLAVAPLESETLVPAGQGALRLSPWGLPPPPEQVAAPPAGGSESDSDAPDAGQGKEQTRESAAPGGDDIPGLPSDRESVATALKEATNLIQWGKPLARKGLEIKTVRPRWRTTTLLTRVPRNPVVMVSFDPDGRVAHAEFIQLNGRRLNSGSRDVDGPLLDAVYKWRATGKELKKLGKDDRISFAIRVVLRGR